MAVSKNKIKFIRSLTLKKNRDKEGLFVAEGNKLVEDLMSRFEPKFVAAKAGWLACHDMRGCETAVVESADEMKHISSLATPSSVLAIFEQRPAADIDNFLGDNQLILALDSIQDPGNLGTIVRIADWFGIKQILCSHTTADIYNTKTIQSTMGSIARVDVHYTNLETLLPKLRADGWNICGTFLDGETIYDSELAGRSVIVMGNEGNGISEALAKMVTHRLFIPPYPVSAETVESLNVAVATAIVCSEFRRRER